MEPAAFIDGLVKGVVLIAYDFVKMTCLGLTIPFVRRTRRFWPALLSEQKYLSPLTYLTFWVLLAAAIALSSTVDLASNATGFNKATGGGFAVVKTIILALAFVILADQISKIPLWRLKGVRRGLYNGLMRIAVANVFIAACLVMTFAPVLLPRRWELLVGPFPYVFLASLFSKTLDLSEHGILYRVPHPLIIIFAAPLGIVIVKALSIQGRLTKLLVGALFALAVPTLLLNLSGRVTGLVTNTVSLLSESARPKIYPAFLTCSLSKNRIRVTGYLKVEGTKTLLFKSEQFEVYTVETVLFPGDYISTVDAGQPDIMVSEGTFAPIELTSEYDPGAATVKNLDEGEFSCSLRVHKSPWEYERPLRELESLPQPPPLPPLPAPPPKSD